MPTVFTMIMNGDIPGRFVWADDAAVAFLSINPLSHGHTLVVPRVEVDRWTDLDAATWRHVGDVAHAVGRAIDAAFSPARVGTVVAGFEVPHVHVHVFGADTMATFDFARAALHPDPAAMDAAAADIRAALRDLGHGAHVPAA